MHKNNVYINIFQTHFTDWLIMVNLAPSSCGITSINPISLRRYGFPYMHFIKGNRRPLFKKKIFFGATLGKRLLLTKVAT